MEEKKEKQLVVPEQFQQIAVLQSYCQVGNLILSSNSLPIENLTGLAISLLKEIEKINKSKKNTNNPVVG